VYFEDLFKKYTKKRPWTKDHREVPYSQTIETGEYPPPRKK